MKRNFILLNIKKTAIALALIFSSSIAFSQTNVYDNIIATSPNHTSLKAAIQAANLQGALQNPAATLTVFAPDNAAFSALATSLGVTVPDLLVLPNLSDILLYHVLGTTANAASITNGLIVQPLNPANTIKLSIVGGNVFANQAQVNAADLTAANGVVHSLNAVILPNLTVADVAIGNTAYSSLVAALVKAELLPVVTDPFSKFTVFAPSNTAFTNLATALNVTVADLLNLPTLRDILLYHVLATEVPSSAVTNGMIATPASTTNTLKLTKKGNGDIFVNQAKVVNPDLTATNGVVHTLDAVVLPSTTVVDVALSSTNFSSLVAAVVKAELLPALTNPLTQLTVFAPTNTAFTDLATALGTDINGILALPNLADVLLYHVVAGKVLSTDLTNGSVVTLNGASVIVDLTNGVKINASTVTTADLLADNGVVHVIDKVLIPGTAGVESNEADLVKIYPNPSSDILNITNVDNAFNSVRVFDAQGRVVLEADLNNELTQINVRNLKSGYYTVQVEGLTSTVTKSLLIASQK